MADHEHSWEVISIKKGLLRDTEEMLVRCTQCDATGGAELEETITTSGESHGVTSSSSQITIWGWVQSSDPEINELQDRAHEEKDNPDIQRHVNRLCDAYRQAKRQS